MKCVILAEYCGRCRSRRSIEGTILISSSKDQKAKGQLVDEIVESYTAMASSTGILLIGFLYPQAF